MNISYSWLRQYIDINLSPAQVAQVLTSIGLEVEAVESVEKIRGGLEGFVIGEVKTCQKHPGADKLSVTTVDVGKEPLLNVVCGAPNVAAGQKVVVATIGTMIYKGNESFQIKKAKIRGEESEGMICAEDEMGLGASHDGIMVLPADASIGMAAQSYFHVEPEVFFSIGLTPNRIDSASHIGVARDLAAYLKKDMDIKVIWPSVEAFKVENESYPVSVTIENPRSCRRYAGVSVSGVKTGPSPDWLQDRLKSIGMNPVNNIVDVTNFILHELGQPLHAFDADELKGRKIVVKNLPEGTPFVTLDGIERLLSSADLMICDGEKAVAIGGVFGGLHSGVTDKTTNIFIESAYFDPVSVRRTAKKHNLSTDASFRFERGVDPEMTITALKRCALLMKEVAGGNISSSIVDVYPNPIFPVKVQVSFAHIDRLIGKKINHDLVRSILLSLDFKVLAEDAAGYQLEVAPYRVDVTREADVIEEILRIYGYNNVEPGETLNSSLSYTPKPDKDKLVDLVSEHLVANGYYEIMCNSLTSSAYYNNLETYTSNHLARIMNPLSNELDCMRQTLLFGGLETIRHNANRQHPDLRLFEFGNCYFFNPGKVTSNPLDHYSESFMLTFFLTGKRVEANWSTPETDSSLYQLKSHLRNVFLKLGMDFDTLEEKPLQEKKDIYAAGLTYKRNGLTVADLAIVRQSILKQFDLQKDVFYAEIHWDNAMKLRGDHKINHHELPRFPEVRRDLSMLIDRNITYAQLKDIAYRTERKLLTRISLFDVYEGEKIGKDKKSYALSFILQDTEATLTDERIDRIMKRLMDAYKKDLGAEIRK